MDITKLKTRLRFRSAKKTTNQASLTDVVNDLEAISVELNTTVKVTNSASGLAKSVNGRRDLTGLLAQMRLQRQRFAGSLIGAPSWAGTEAVIVGRLRKLASGQLVQCVTAGTTGGSEPTFASAQPITDGTAVWWAAGRMSRVASGYPVPSVTANGSITGLALVPLFTSQDRYLSASCPNLIAYLTAGAAKAWTFNDGSAESVHGIGTGLRGYLRTTEFFSDAPKIGLGFHHATNARARIYVRDADSPMQEYLIEEDPTPNPAGAPAYQVIDFGIRKLRRYRVETSGTLNFAGAAVDAQSALYAAQIEGPCAVWLSDSYGYFASTYSIDPWDYISERFAREFGIRHMRNFAIGGTGYLSVGDVGHTYYPAPDVLTNNPPASWPADFVFCWHGGNDKSLSLTDMRAAAARTWATARAQYPSSVIVVIGTWSGSTGPSAEAVAADAAIGEQFATWGDSNSYFVSPQTGPGKPWVSGTGKSSALSGAGNSDFYVGADGTHPTLTGIPYHVGRLCTDIDSALSAAIG